MTHVNQKHSEASDQIRAPVTTQLSLGFVAENNVPCFCMVPRVKSRNAASPRACNAPQVTGTNTGGNKTRNVLEVSAGLWEVSALFQFLALLLPCTGICALESSLF